MQAHWASCLFGLRLILNGVTHQLKGVYKINIVQNAYLASKIFCTNYNYPSYIILYA